MSFGQPDSKDELIKDLNNKILALENEKLNTENIIGEKERLMNLKNMDLRNNLD